jgi:hypothetical protein
MKNSEYTRFVVVGIIFAILWRTSTKLVIYYGFAVDIITFLEFSEAFQRQIIIVERRVL